MHRFSVHFFNEQIGAKMKKQIITLICGMLLATSLLQGCGEKNDKTDSVGADNSVQVMEENATKGENTDINNEESENTEATESKSETDVDSDVTVRIGGLKGATTLGLLPMFEENNNSNYEFTMATAPDEIAAKLVKGELDIVLIPSNLASILYNKTEGGISVIDINTLGVLYMVSADTSISKPKDLIGKTIYLTGRGNTPDYVLQYILKENGISDKVSVEYKSEPTEVAGLLSADSTGTAIGLLPQPFATVACMQNERLSIVMDMNKEWENISGKNGSKLVTGVTVVRNEFLKEHKMEVDKFIEAHKKSVEEVNKNVEKSAALAVKAEIIPKEPIATKAIPQCNITCITGEEMQRALSGYLEVLYGMEQSSVGGSLPGEEFYY